MRDCVNAYDAHESGKAERTRHAALKHAVGVLADELEVGPDQLVGALGEAFRDRYYVHRCNALDRLVAIVRNDIPNGAA